MGLRHATPAIVSMWIHEFPLGPAEWFCLRDALAQGDDVPVLIIAGNDTDEALAAPRLARASRSVEIGSPEATAHTQSLSRHSDGWEARVTDFLVFAVLDAPSDGHIVFERSGARA